ncbi:MAG TPA: NAD(P)/FAD-dependent oxidoreductase [Thermoanaerobaculia bacterium]|jgi:thioredoxin reductase|nr:NAD(P)/FAD-dependent oxidoreductase [Thermoanaerobaculia bacterium]
MASDPEPGSGGGARAPIVYDTAVVGGGPAGLTAALHLAWHARKVVVIDRTTGPLYFTLELLHNVPGMPAASGAEIQKRLRAQARDMGAELVRGNVVSAAGAEGKFQLAGADGEQWRARTLLLATGVARYHPTVDGDFTPCLAYAGKGTMFYCPDCEAPEVVGKDTVVIAAGTADAGAALALSLTRYTRRLRLLLTGDTALSGARAGQLAAAGIPVIAGAIRRLLGDKRNLHGLELASGETLAAEAFFVSSPSPGRTDLARQLGVEMSPHGDHAVPRSQRGETNVAGVWIAGDLRPLTQQVAIAMGTGSIAAVMIDQHLRRQEVGAGLRPATGDPPPAAG